MKVTCKLPRTKKSWFSFGLILFVIALGNWPFIPLFNKPSIILGMPIMMVWSIFIIIFTTGTLWFVSKIKGFS
ncbi:hypothetical protein J32TS6_08560 [Virgibacillus pantothenticus]|uniref:Permease n=1 Tax=Virgibacillus pantothenticus TaxID=1473 RepID=A0A0L0QN24_VIRPA|nr:hypothetical protein [Virgibacillus pantothenticus]KNE19976.1 hypothetical protein AFK71_16375 [Virgibacillus pantothenticus]MBU8564996.1 hypothetical protein [Virgibacillus pantothenticus]MBU8599303.1 hypothetical protein [Virgibacillus pantothenticus]MBU8633294.1 hypothetical protein [Virgibacillus pantothenticus]MBU8641045.1 hypothetical protein [Virgibacillus pantothenticus]